MSNSSFQCIESNSDIAGIGVRSAIYSQALLSILVPTVFISDGKLTDNESRIMARISINIALTACALLVSTIIQANTVGISLYHALIILQLSRMNSTTFMTIFFVSLKSWLINAVLCSRSLTRPERLKQLYELIQVHLIPLILSSLHFTAVGAVGVWVWYEIQRFGNQPECNQYTFIVVLTKTVHGEPRINETCSAQNPLQQSHCIHPVTHGQRIRDVSLVLYAIALLPFENVMIISILLAVSEATIYEIMTAILVAIRACLRLTLVFICPCLSSEGASANSKEGIVAPKSFARFIFYFHIFGMALIMIILIIDTELMIHRSSDLVQPGESQWTFGQTLSMLLQLLPLWEIMVTIRENFGLLGKHSHVTEAVQDSSSLELNSV